MNKRAGRRWALAFIALAILALPLAPGAGADSTGLPELSISRSDISISNSSPLEGEPVFINTTVHVHASAPAGPVSVELDIDGRLAGLRELSIEPNMTFVNISFQWWTHGGRHTLTVVVDPADELAETDELDNTASTELQVRRLPASPAVMDWPLLLSLLFLIACAASAALYLHYRFGRFVAESSAGGINDPAGAAEGETGPDEARKADARTAGEKTPRTGEPHLRVKE